MPFATLNGNRAHYETYGQGDPLLLVSGLGGPAVGWLLQVNKAPPQVLVGKEDILTPPAFSRALAGMIPDARLRILPGAHAFFLEEAPRFNGALLEFLKGVRK